MKPGEIIGQRFEIEQQAGAGGMGVVYRARDRVTGAPVAVKVMTGHRLEHHARFARESEVLSGLAHPAIVRYVAHGATPEGEPFLAMEWIEGEPLSERLARGRLSIHETVALASRVADALAAAHRAGVVHRDLKPSNVMLAGREIARAKLVDFGVARVSDGTNLTATGAMIGTIGYMSPEQARGESEIGARADVFALGAVIFKCLAGRAPFEGGEPLAGLLRLINEDAPRLSSVLDGVPAPIDDLLTRMLARSPALRPQDGAATLDELRRLGTHLPGPRRARGGPASAAPPSMPPTSVTPAPPSAVEARTAGSLPATIHPPSMPPPSMPAPPSTTALPPSTTASPRKTLPIGRILLAAGALVVTAAAAILAYVLLGGPSATASLLRPCLLERCERIDLPSSIDVSQLIPRVRAVVQGIDRSAVLVIFTTTSSIRNGAVDTARGNPTFFFRVNNAQRGRNTITASMIEGRLEMRWTDTPYEMRNLPDPRCSGAKLTAVARARGIGVDGALIYAYVLVQGNPAWTLTATHPRPAVMIVHEPGCDPAPYP